MLVKTGKPLSNFFMTLFPLVELINVIFSCSFLKFIQSLFKMESTTKYSYLVTMMINNLLNCISNINRYYNKYDCNRDSNI